MTKPVADGLCRLLADTYNLYLKTHNFHWNVTGPYFTSLHILFEQQYNELALAVDEIAERIRALDYPAPGSYSQFAKLGHVKEETGLPNAHKMIELLLADQHTVIDAAKELFPLVEKAHDQATIDLLTRRILIHEKNAWMLKSLLA